MGMRLYRTTITFFIILLSCMLMLSACSNENNDAGDAAQDNNENNTPKDEKDDGDEQTNDDEVNEMEGSENKTENDTDDFRTDLGNTEVWFGGEVHVDEDEVVVEGESNLLPETRIKSGAISGDWAVIDYQETTRVEEDGSFSFTLPGRDSNTSARLSVYSADDETYGENLEKVTGNHVYKTKTENEFDVKATYEIDTDKELPYTIPLERDDWEKPDDYGDTDIWIDADYTTDHNYIHLDVKSNIMEGAHVGGNLRKSSDGIEPFSHDYTEVEPDGSFRLKVQYHDLREGMYMPIKFEPHNNADWDHLKDAYGENGEQLEGDLVEKDDDGNYYVEKHVEIVAPELDPPEEVDITQQDEEMKLQVPDDILFDFDESDLKDGAKDTLDELINDLETLDDDTELDINGHTDNEGEADYNMDLSEERADAVMDYIEANSDLAENLSIDVEGYGETDPIDSNEDSKGRERNRRVEIVVNPNE